MKQSKSHRKHHKKSSKKGGFSFSRSSTSAPAVQLNETNPGIGNVNFITFIGVVFSRLAYLSDCGFIRRYNMIFGNQARNKDFYNSLQDASLRVNQPPCIQYKSPPVFTNTTPYPIGDCVLNKIGSARIEDIFNDALVFKGMNLYTFNGQQYVNFIPYAKHINYVNGEASETGAGIGDAPVAESIDSAATSAAVQQGGAAADDNVKYISVAWSNYSIVYIVADKRMNSLWLSFRGTASLKAGMSYMNTGALYPQIVCENGDRYFAGIFKITTEQIHTILEAMRYLTVSFLNPTQPESVKVFATGHSLGGGMCTIFSYLWQNIRTKPVYNENGFDKLTKKIVCISVAAPRVINKKVLEKYQGFIKDGSILYKRVITKGDPIVDLPPQTLGFYHPSNGIEEQVEVVNYCNNLVSVSKSQNKQIFIDYSKPLDCIRKKPSAVLYSRNPLAHGFYLYIAFFKPIKNFGKEGQVSRVNPANDQVSKTGVGGDTVCRVIFGDAGNRKVAFFNSLESRGEKTRDADGKVIDTRSISGIAMKNFVYDLRVQDILMTPIAFQSLVAGMTEIIDTDINPNFGTILHVFDMNSKVDNVSCVGPLASDNKPAEQMTAGRITRKNRRGKHSKTKRLFR
jgi:hypothetical protein